MYQPNYRNENRNFVKPGELRINYQIKVQQVRLLRDEEQLGIVSTDYARKLADEAGLDLVEMVAHANPPICKIMDYGKFKYEKKLKDKETAKKQRESQIQIKEIRLRPAIDVGDVETKLNQAKKFLKDGCKVQIVIQFKGRELAHRENGILLMQKIVSGLMEAGNLDSDPKFEGTKMICSFTAKS